MATILGANTLSSGYDIDNSLMFNDNDSAYLSKTLGSNGNQKTFTWSAWIKRGNIGTSQFLFDVHANAQHHSHFYISSGNVPAVYTANGNYSFSTKNRLADPAAWYHLVFRIDTTDGTNSNRVRIYINGTEATYDSYSTISQNTNFEINGNGSACSIGRRNAGDYFDGYMAEIFFCDGQSYAPTVFGEYSSTSPSVWIPKNCKDDLSFGTHGYYFPFDDSSDLGDDESGTGNDFAENNIAATDQSTDTPTNNFATFNGRVKGSTSPTFLQGNIQVDAGGNWGHAVGTIGLASGKWYWEIDNITASSNVFFGICNEFNVGHLDNDSTPYSEAGLILYFQDGRRTVDGTDSEGEYNAYGTTMACALDLDSGTKTIKFFRDNSEEGSVNLTANFPDGEFVFPIFMGSASSNACGVDFNFGGTISTALASAESDANGYGSFEFAPPSGYYAICAKNIADYG